MALLPGIVSGRKVRVSGFNGAVANTEEHLFSGSTTFTDLAAATLLKISSGSANDTSAGTGAKTVMVFGLDGNYNLQSETVTLNGQTEVLTTKTYLAVFGLEVLTVGTGLKNAGIVYAADDGATVTAGVPATLILCTIPVGENISFSGNYIIPAGMKYRLNGIVVGNRAQIVDTYIKLKEYGGAWKYYLTIPASATHPSTYIDLKELEIVLPAKTGIELAAKAATTGGVTQASLVLELVP